MLQMWRAGIQKTPRCDAMDMTAQHLHENPKNRVRYNDVPI